MAFESSSPNLVRGDDNRLFDVFVRDLARGRNERVSVDVGGDDADDDAMRYPEVSAYIGGASPDISGNGRFVAFASRATDLVGGPADRAQDIFVRDRQAGTTQRVTLAFDGRAPDGHSFLPAISDDGRVVVFLSDASNLVPGDGNGARDVFVHDLVAGTTVRANVDVDGGDPDAGFSHVAGSDPEISGDGRSVVFSSEAADLVAGDGNAQEDVFVRDLAAGVTTRVSVDSEGGDADGSSRRPTIDDDGTRIVFDSDAQDIANLEISGFSGLNVFVRDLTTGQTRQLSAFLGTHSPRQDSFDPAISGDGRHVAFESWVPFAGPDRYYYDDSSDLYLVDADTGRFTFLTYDTLGDNTGEGVLGEVSGDGGAVVFESPAHWMTEPAEDDDLSQDVYVRFTR